MTTTGTDQVLQFRALYRELRIADQRRFYEERQREYQRAHQQAIVIRNVFLGLAAGAGLAGQVVAGGGGRSLCGVAATVFAALAGAVTAYETLIGFASLDKLYQDAALNLKRAEVDWDDAGPGSNLAADVERVEQIFRTENGQWGQLVVQGLPQVAQTGVAPGGGAQTGVAPGGGAQTGVAQTSAPQSGVAQTCAGQDGGAQTGMAETGAAQGGGGDGGVRP